MCVTPSFLKGLSDLIITISVVFRKIFALSSVIIFMSSISLIFFNFLYKLKIGKTCPPVPPVDSNIFVIITYSLLVLKLYPL